MEDGSFSSLSEADGGRDANAPDRRGDPPDVAADGPAPITCGASAGELDPDFGRDGVAAPSIGDPDEWLWDAGFDGAGNLVAIGMTGFGPIRHFLMRIRPDGSNDPDFGDGGVDLSKGPFASFWPNGMAVQPDGKVVLFGAVPDPNLPNVVLRLLPNGAPDTGFGKSGMVTLDVERINDVAPDPSGRILVTGARWNTTVPGTYVRRLRADGSLDDGFGHPFLPVADDFDFSSFPSIAFRPLGGAYTWSGHSPGVFRVAQLDENGELDDGFGTHGVFDTHLAGFPVMNPILVDAASRIYEVAGIGIRRHRPDGAIDTSFRKGEWAGLPNVTTGITGAAVGDDRRPVVATTTPGDASDMTLVGRFLEDGSFDTSFGSEGLARLQFPGESQWTTRILVGPAGRICMVGTRRGVNQNVGHGFAACLCP